MSRTLLIILLTALAELLPAQRTPNGRPSALAATAHELPAGPIVTFVTSAGGGRHVMNVYAAGCEEDAPAGRIWQNEGNVKVLRRLDRDHLLLSSFGDFYGTVLLNVRNGEHRVFIDGGDDIVAVRDDEVLYIGDNRWGKGDNYLYARSWKKDEEPRRMFDKQFLEVPIVAGNLAIGILGGTREVWSVSLVRKTGRKLYELPDDAMQPRLALSPGGQRLAIGMTPGWKGRVAVVDLGTGKVLREWQDLPLDLSPFSSFSPTVELAFHDDDQITWSETRGDAMRGGEFVHVRRSIESGEITDETAYAEVGLYHTAPAPGGRKPPPPTFYVDGTPEVTRLFRTGKKEPIAEVGRKMNQGRIRIALDGSYAIVRPRENPSHCMLHRAGKPPLKVFDGSGYDFAWWPARPAPNSAPKDAR